MLRDFVLELVAAPSNGTTITLTGTPPAGRVSWATGFVTSQPVFYVLDDSIQQEWGVGTLTIGAPSTIARPTVVLGNSAGTTARLTFSGTTRCFSGLPSAAALGALGGGLARNMFHNGMDRIQQRGAGAFTTASYTSDRWLAATGTAGGTRSITVAAFGDAGRTAVGDEEAAYGLVYVFSGGSGAGDYDLLLQRLESVRRTAGKTITISFWAIAASGTPSVGVSLTQSFGTGGSPSSAVLITAQTVTLSTTWTRYSLTFAVPTIIGKTLGTTANTDFLSANFWLSSGSTNNAAAGAIGVQAATVTFFGRQLEIGSFATPLEKQDIRYDLANCQRFYQIGQNGFAGYATAGTSVYASQSFPVQMRATPTMAIATNNCSNVGTPTWAGLAPGGMGATLLGTVASTGGYTLNVNYTATADL